MDIAIYHNPSCGTSRKVLETIRNAGFEPVIVEYLKTPPDKETLKHLIGKMAVSVRSIIREREAPYRELGLDDPSLTDEQLLEAIAAHPVLLNRPIVVSDLGAKLCRPAETVVELLPS